MGHDYTGTTGTVTASYAAKPAGVALVYRPIKGDVFMAIKITE